MQQDHRNNDTMTQWKDFFYPPVDAPVEHHVDEQDDDDDSSQDRNDELMIRRHGRTITSLVCLFGVLIPLAGMMQCQGWNEGSMEVQSCLIDTSFTREYANALYGVAVLFPFYGWFLYALNRFLVGLVGTLCCDHLGRGSRARYQQQPQQELV